MPALGLAILPAILAAAGGAVTAGESIYSALNKPSMPKAPTTPPGLSAVQKEQTVNAERSSISNQLPNIVSSTSGLASPEYVATIAQLLSGTAGQYGSRGTADSLVRAAFGLPASTGPATGGGASETTAPFTPATATNANLTPSGDTGLSDFVRHFVT